MTQQKKIDGSFKMPFGKYKGEKIEDVPLDYIEWMAENLEAGKYNNDAILVECQNQIALKKGEGVGREPEKKGLMFKLPKK